MSACYQKELQNGDDNIEKEDEEQQVEDNIEEEEGDKKEKDILFKLRNLNLLVSHINFITNIKKNHSIQIF